MVSVKFFENYMKIAGPLGNVMFYLQAYKIFASGDSCSISIPAFLLGFAACTSWLIYGIMIRNTPLILSNIVGSSGAFLVLLGTAIYH